MVTLNGAWDAPAILKGQVSIRVKLFNPTTVATTAVRFLAGDAVEGDPPSLASGAGIAVVTVVAAGLVG